MRLGIVRFDPERLLERGDGVVEFALLLEHNPPIAVRFGMIRVEIQRLFV